MTLAKEFLAGLEFEVAGIGAVIDEDGVVRGIDVAGTAGAVELGEGCEGTERTAVAGAVAAGSVTV